MTDSRFDLYTKTVNIDGVDYKIRPLSGRFLPRFYKVAKAMEAAKKAAGDSEEGFLEHLTEELVGDIHVLCLQTMVSSYPDMSSEQVDAFVSQNLWSIFSELVAVNTKQKA